MKKGEIHGFVDPAENMVLRDQFFQVDMIPFVNPLDIQSHIIANIDVFFTTFIGASTKPAS